MRKGVSPLIATVFSILFGIVMLVTVMTVINPALQRARDSAAISEVYQNLPLLDTVIKEVASESQYSKRNIPFTVTTGNYKINESRDYIYFTFEPNEPLPLSGTKGDIKIERGLSFVDYFNWYVENSKGTPEWINISGEWAVENYEYSGINGTSYHDAGYHKSFEVSGKIRNMSGSTGGQIFVLPTNVNNLVGFWSFDEGSGSAAYDWSGHNNTGTLTYMNTTGNATSGWTSDCKFGSCLKFDGVNDYVNTGNDTSLRSDYLTVSFWFKTNIINTAQQIISKSTGVAQGYYIRLRSDNNRIEFNLVNGSSPQTIYSTMAFQKDTWYHITTTFDGSYLKIYVNGISDATPASATGTLNNSIEPLIIGVRGDFNQYYFNGTMDEVRIYNVSLSATQVQAEYELGLKKLRATGTLSISSEVSNTYIALANPGGHTHFDDIKINDDTKELSFIIPYTNIDLTGSVRFPTGEHRIIIEHKGVNTTLNKPIIEIRSE